MIWILQLLHTVGVEEEHVAVLKRCWLFVGHSGPVLIAMLLRTCVLYQYVISDTVVSMDHLFRIYVLSISIGRLGHLAMLLVI